MVCIGLQKCHSGDLNWTNINMYPPAHSLLYVFCEKWETLPEKNQESLFTMSYSAISDTLSASCWLPLTLRNTTINSSNARFPSSILLTLSFQLKSNSILSFKNTLLIDRAILSNCYPTEGGWKGFTISRSIFSQKESKCIHTWNSIAQSKVVLSSASAHICSHIWVFPRQTHKTTPIWIHFTEYSPPLFILSLNTRSNMSTLVQRTMHNVPETESFVLLLPLFRDCKTGNNGGWTGHRMITVIKIVPEKRTWGERVEEKEVWNIMEEFNQAIKENTTRLRR